jgi:alkanesulfonate monooxygenase
LKQAWTKEAIDFRGQFYKFKLPTNPVKPYQNGGPLLYFGGYSPPAVDLCAQHCDVYLMWPETEENLRRLMENMSQKAAKYKRKVDFGLRVHVVVRETEEEACEYAESIISKLDLDTGQELRERALDAQSYGVSRQKEMREQSSREGYVEPHLWTGIGKARSGCGAALVGNPDQIVEKLNRYMDMGIRSFIFSGYPHIDECNRFAELVLPRLKTFSMPQLQGKTSKKVPLTPLADGIRV